MRLGSTALATQRVERRLAAILAADIAAYSRLMGADEEGTHERVKAHFRQLIDPKIREHRGRIVKNTGDGMLVEFSSVVDAVRCAAETQRAMIDRNADIPEDQRISFRMGINLGDVIVEPEDIFGDGVNIAARLEALAEPGGICISRVVRDQIRDKLSYPFEDMGEQSVKNIARPVRAYAISVAAVASLPQVPSIAEARNPITSLNAPRLSIVVLPFVNLSNDPQQEYFAEGITDDLTTDLSRISGSFVIARNTAFTYKGKQIDAKQIGRELGVRYVLEGSVRRVDDQVRVNVQLVDGESGAQLWADRFDTDRANLGQAQDEITGRLARTLNLELVEASVRRSEQERAVDPDARDLVMRGWALSNRMASAATREEAQRAFERALEIDPESVDARIGLGEVLVSGEDMEGGSNSLHQNITRAEQLLLEAFERDPKRSRAHLVMGLIRRWQGRLPDSKIELEAAIALDPNQASGHRQLGVTLMFLGQPEAAIPQLDKSTRLSPHDPFIALNYNALGRCHLFLGQLDEAIDLLRKARTTSPRYYFIHLNLAAALGLRGDLNEARAALAEGVKLRPELNSLARLRATVVSNNIEYLRLREKTTEVGLRRAGMPEE
jgi:TolB-like protein/class 3 adenylate cyclase/lipopolysaccharide biosynthesis regulator YciM